MAISAELFREVFRRWPSGVAVVTSCLNDQKHGMVVGSFCSLSIDPPLVMFSAGRLARTRAMIDESGVFAVSILNEDQVEIFERFAGFDRSHDDDRFAGFTTFTRVTGAPIFADAVAWVDCRVVDRHPGETYTIYIGEVLDASLGDREGLSPLVYLGRKLRRVADLHP